MKIKHYVETHGDGWGVYSTQYYHSGKEQPLLTDNRIWRFFHKDKAVCEAKAAELSEVEHNVPN